MEWQIIFVVYGTLFISSPLIAILHELGHAFAYLLLTKPDKVDIYIGTYTLPQSAINFKVGKIEFYIKRSFPFVKGIGLCKSYTPETNYINYIIILLAGTIFTVFIAAIPVIIILNTSASLLFTIACYVFLAISTLSLISNLVPREVGLLNKLRLDNDGQQILFTLKIKQGLPDYVDGIQSFINKDFQGAINSFNKVLSKVPDEKKILRLIITASFQIRHFDEACKFTTRLENKFELNLNDLINKGNLQLIAGDHKGAIETYNKVLRRDRKHLLALNNIGFALIKEGAHEVAAHVLNRAIKIDPKFDMPYNNLGYSNVLQGNLDAGKAFLDQSAEINPDNAYTYKYLGIYYLKLSNNGLAKINFDKAVKLDKYIDMESYQNELELATI